MYYAVKCGRVSGIYDTWDECKKQVDRFPNAAYKKFPSYVEATSFVSGKKIVETNNDTEANIPAVPHDERNVAYIDGSYNEYTLKYGWGGFLVDNNGIEHIIQGSDGDVDLRESHNVAGEVMGALAAVKLAINLGMKNIKLYYDYMGIECWATGKWKCTKPVSATYKANMDVYKKYIKINFCHVKGHSGNIGNERADKLAKQAVGL